MTRHPRVGAAAATILLLVASGCNSLTGSGDLETPNGGSGAASHAGGSVGHGGVSNNGAGGSGGEGLPPECKSGSQDGAETDVDCGGPSCNPCADGLKCNAPSDCESQVCAGNVCAKPSCLDKLKNALETDVDCGGGACPTCAEGFHCNDGTDCESATCESSLCVSAACVQGGAIVTACVGGDACCPTVCTHVDDSDCPIACGDGRIETGETCDPVASCPTSCDDADACTQDVLSGEPASCTSKCGHVAIADCANDDDCCPPGCSQGNDNDCSADCPTAADACGDRNCGSVPDGCGGIRNCGSCVAEGETCGGAGTPGVCGSSACVSNLEDACNANLGDFLNCGPVNYCGQTSGCGTCSVGNCGFTGGVVTRPNYCEPAIPSKMHVSIAIAARP